MQQDVVEFFVEEDRQEFTRNDFIQQLGLQWDPFLVPVAEQELIYSNQGASLLFFFRQQDPDNVNQSIVYRLCNPRPSFVFGEPGMGKTALRLATSAYRRSISNHSLAVTYIITRDFNAKYSVNAHLHKLSQQIAIDLFLQILEQFNLDFDKPSKLQIEGLGNLLTLGEQPLQKLVQYILQEPEPNERMGLAKYWYKAGRLPIRHIDRSKQLINLLQQATASKTHVKSPKIGEKALEKSLHIARLWGFEDIYLFVDGVDTWERSADDMFAIIEALLKQTASLSLDRHIYVKYFLPQILFERVSEFINQTRSLAQQLPDMVQLHWSKSDLRRLLKQRLRSAGSRRSGLNGLLDPTWEVDLDEMIIQKANGSPRNLLSIINLLIDKHVERIALIPSTNGNGSNSYFSQDDWRRMVYDFDAFYLNAATQHSSPRNPSPSP